MREPGRDEERRERRRDERSEQPVGRAQVRGARDDGEQRSGQRDERRQPQPRPGGDAAHDVSSASRRRRSRRGRALVT